MTGKNCRDLNRAADRVRYSIVSQFPYRLSAKKKNSRNEDSKFQWL